MAKSLFTLKLGIEEAPPVNMQDIPQSDVSLADPINDGNIEDYAEANQELTKQTQSIEEHIDVVDNLNEQVKVQEETIEGDPYSITENSVELSQENLTINLGRLGVAVEEYHNLYRSNYRTRVAELNRPNALKKLKISNEGIADVIETIIEKIKAAFRALANMFKNLFQKLMDIFDNTGKKAEALLTKIDAATIDTNLSDDTKEKINEKWRFVQLLDVAKSTCFDFPMLDQAIQNSLTAFQSIGAKADEPNFSFVNALSANNVGVSGDYAKDVGNGKTCIIKCCGGTGKYFVAKSDKEYAIESIDKEKVPDITNFNVDKAKLKRGLEIVVHNCVKEKDQFKNKAENIRKEADKILNTFNNKKASELDDTAKAILSFAGKLGSVIILDIINNYREFNRGIVRIATLLIEKKDDKDAAKDDKEDKKNEEAANKNN